MQYLTSVEKKRITANATLLSTGVDSDDTTLVFQHAVFEASDAITIGGEEITLGSTSDNLTFTGCIRGGGAVEEHVSGQEAFLKDGTELVSHTFNGVQYFNAFSASANVEMTFGIMEDTAVKERVRTTASNLSWFRPFHREQPAENKVWSVVAWLRYDNATEAEASGAFQS